MRLTRRGDGAKPKDLPGCAVGGWRDGLCRSDDVGCYVWEYNKCTRTTVLDPSHFINDFPLFLARLHRKPKQSAFRFLCLGVTPRRGCRKSPPYASERLFQLVSKPICVRCKRQVLERDSEIVLRPGGRNDAWAWFEGPAKSVFELTSVTHASRRDSS